MQKKWGVIALSTLGIIGLTAGSMVFAAEDAAKWPERNAAIQTSLENNNFTAWKSAIGDRHWAADITAEQFQTLRQIHELRQQGKFEEAKKLADESGLKPEMGMKKGQGRGMKGQGNQPDHEAVLAAITAGDYTTWKSLMGDRPVTSIITLEKFPQFQKMHELLANKDVAGAAAIAKELGLPEHAGKNFEKRGMGNGRGMGRMMGQHAQQ